MNIPELSVKYPVSVLMLFSGIVMLGLISVARLPINLFPDIRYPRITIVTETQGLAPEEVERRISEPLERLMAGVKNVQDIASISRADQSIVMVDFVWGTDMDFAMLDVKKSSGDLREDYVSMSVLRFDPNAQPVLTLGISGGDNLEDLRRMAQRNLKPMLEKVPGVASAEVAGGLTTEVRVTVDALYLAAYGFPYEQIIGAIRSANINATGGWIEDANRRLIVRAVGEFKTLEDIADVVVGYKQGKPVALREIAAIQQLPVVEDSIVRINGEVGVGISLYKEPEANTVRVVEEVRKMLDPIRRELPLDIKITEAYDQSRFIQEAIGEVQKSAFYGILLAVGVLFYFLRNIRSTLVIGLAIPLSIVATFNLMYFGNLSLNIMTLGGLALGAGMLVDNAIVVLENIFRLRQEGKSPREAAIQGCSEVGAAITSSTLTTCVVFFPIVYIRGVTGLLFKEQALTVVFSLMMSLLVALSFLPMVCSRFLKAQSGQPRRRAWYNPLRWLSNLMYSERLKDYYAPLLGWCIHHRLVVVLMTGALVWGSASLFPLIKQEFIPKSDQPQFVIELAMPIGTRLGVTDQAAARLEGKMRERGGEIHCIYSEIGIPEESKRRAEDEVRGPHTARVLVTLATDTQPPASALNVIQHLQSEADAIYGADIKYLLYANTVEGFFGTDKAPLVIEVRGPRLESLKQIAQDLSRQIEGIPGLVNLQANLLAGNPQLNIIPDRTRLSDFQLDIRQLAEQIKSQLIGQRATLMKDQDGERDIIVEMRSIDEDTVDALSEMRIQLKDGRAIKLGEIARMEVVPGPLEILRRDSERRALVLADLEGVKLSEAVAAVRERLDQFYLPRGYTLRIGGEEESRAASFQNLRFALLLALILVYMVMASLFESLLHPFIVMLSTPLAVIGVVIAILLTGSTLNLMAYIGIVMLAGIVVNNAIVLIDCVNRLRGEGLPQREALVQAGRYRLRPILMTTATTVIALLPLALGFGSGSELRAPMAIAVIGGLTSSTLLTLFFIPVIYSLVDDVQTFLYRRLLGRFRQPVVSESSTVYPGEAGK